MPLIVHDDKERKEGRKMLEKPPRSGVIIVFAAHKLRNEIIPGSQLVYIYRLSGDEGNRVSCVAITGDVASKW